MFPTLLQEVFDISRLKVSRIHIFPDKQVDCKLGRFSLGKACPSRHL